MRALCFESVKSVLCLGAHADDIEIGCGGTLLDLASKRSIHVHWIVFSAAGERRMEARQSAQRILAQANSQEVIIHDFPDRLFPQVWSELKSAIHLLSESIDPDLVFTHRLEDRHQDHRILAELTWNAFRRQPILEYEIPKYEGDLGQPSLYVPLSRETCSQKIDILRTEFVTQREKPWFTDDTFWALLRLRGLEAGATSGFAEAFTARKLVFAT